MAVLQAQYRNRFLPGDHQLVTIHSMALKDNILTVVFKGDKNETISKRFFFNNSSGEPNLVAYEQFTLMACKALKIDPESPNRPFEFDTDSLVGKQLLVNINTVTYTNKEQKECEKLEVQGFEQVQTDVINDEDLPF